MVSTAHVFDVPLDHRDPQGSKIEVFARELVAIQNQEANLPYLVYLQGGPGFASPRPARSGGWIKRALSEFRVLLIDQRGTGLSAPINEQSLAVHETPEAQAEYLSLFRADSIVRDCEVIRAVLRAEPWTILGQSFGGFCALSYLSIAPQGLKTALFTGGLPPISGHADQVYEATYQRVLKRNVDFFNRYPDDRARVDQIVDYLRQHDVTLPTGTRLTPRVFQQLGMCLGAHDGAETLHYLLERAFISGRAGPELNFTFLRQVENALPFDTNPIYALLHESIYCQREASNWSAHRVGQARHQIIAEDTTQGSVLFTGEMVYPWMFEDYARLRPLTAAAELLAQKSDWPMLYDPEQLARNQVPCAAAIYDHDMYVERALSVETAANVQHMRAWVTNAYEHNGLRADGARIFDRLLQMARGVI
jgi:pimeloyl-ACP methyl ester carboxylesterase